MNKPELKERIWQLITPTITGYGNVIDRLLAELTEEQLEKIVKEMEE